MTEPEFLSYEIVLQLHHSSIERFGGIHGVRDQRLVESALGAAEHTYYIGCGDIYEVSAAYAFHIAQAQAFLDGNKRTAVAAAFTFLKGNGVWGTPDEIALYKAMIDIAEKRMFKAELADLFRKMFSKPIQ